MGLLFLSQQIIKHLKLMRDLSKVLFVCIAFLSFTSTILSQNDGFSYQAVIRDNNNDIIANTQIKVQLSVLQGSDTGTPIFIETHDPITNSGGLVTLEMGAGTAQMGDFSSLGWGNGPYWVKQEVDPDGGTNYTIQLTTPLLSVPLAKYAEKADTAEVARAIVSSSGGSVSPLILPGTIMPYAGKRTATELENDGWLVCDGSTVDTSSYSNLFKAVEYTYGGSGDSFVLPNLMGKYPRGGNSNESGDTGGNEMVQENISIGVNNLPAHSHSIEPHSHPYYDQDFLRSDSGENIADNSQGSVSLAGTSSGNLSDNRTTQANTAGLITDDTGGGQDINLQIEVLDPYITMRYIIKY
jgi:microcystin-dependent protein